jgi:hypothetical protein
MTVNMVKVIESFSEMEESVMNTREINILSNIVIRINRSIYVEHVNMFIFFFLLFYFSLIQIDRHADIPTRIN